jgi:hypothetical protein
LAAKRISKSKKKEQKGKNVMPVEYFIRYKGLCYDVGTKLKINRYGIKEGEIEEFIGGTAYIRFTDGSLVGYSTMPNMIDFDKLIIEIIKPVYWIPEEHTPADNRNRPAPWDVELGWIWYIIIMVVGAIFKDRLLIWFFTTAIFFLWKNGFLNGGKK